MDNPILNLDDPQDGLAWPRAIVIAELARRAQLEGRTPDRSRWSSGIAGVLRQAFAGPEVAEQFEALGDAPVVRRQVGRRTVGGASESSKATWLRQLQQELKVAGDRSTKTPHWSARRGAPPAPLDAEAVLARFEPLVRQLDEVAGLWAEAFGVSCPDGIGDPVVPPRQVLEDRLERELPPTMDWPLRQGAPSTWSLDDLYDYIEVLYDLASWPAQWQHHTFGGCIGHPSDFSIVCGRALYAQQVNQLLQRSTLTVRLADNGDDRGRIVRHDEGAAADAIDAALANAPHAQFDEIQHAITQFRARDRNVHDMRSAIVTLAGVLESHRGLLKKELVDGDENDLFKVANEFDLRHRNAKQKGGYDPIFLEWIFYWYLATTALTGKLIKRMPPPPQSED
jgi:hypothetical protein